MITNETKYALKALLHLAKSADQTGCDAAEIAASQDIAEDVIPSILATLDAGGFVRCSNNRFRLARPAATIMVGQVVRCVDGPLAAIPCVSQTAYKRCTDCRDEAGCEVRRILRLVRDATAFILDNTSLLDMGAGRNLQAVLAEVIKSGVV